MGDKTIKTPKLVITVKVRGVATFARSSLLVGARAESMDRSSWLQGSFPDLDGGYKDVCLLTIKPYI